ncbi:AbrB/MazE/SpoVT family DNA-binding domain-containing protein [Novosphingobium sp. SG707]|uniref:AbrB/MazE/SpoVT family DNA-binding domain-containing protein n=1 Tax=Novosphingobium sp. SG707 TaxID=2586996 RepID=UPI001817CF57|nr:AbrB/MazE/SpoVT family DNA-binding domain-containing protein [Novosphingobium sp. SG707]NKJ00392.1 AbrB family looped-hinge helix DNA binding protein [Novosphingobium sp. SG707]
MTDPAPNIHIDADRVHGIRRLRALHCRMLLQLEEMFSGKLGRRFSGGTYRTFLLELYLAEHEGTATFQSCLATGEPPANTHRRSAELAKCGILQRVPDSGDHRRINLSLAPKVRQTLDEVMDRIVSAPAQPSADGTGEIGRKAQSRSSSRVGIHAIRQEKAVTVLRGRVIAGGRIALPAPVRDVLGLRNGDHVRFELSDGEVRILPDRHALRLIQQHLRGVAPLDGPASCELIARRRLEASHGG